MMLWKKMASSLIQSCLILRRVSSFSHRTISSRALLRPSQLIQSAGLRAYSTTSATMTGSVEKDKQLVQDMIYRIRECNLVPAQVRETIMDFVVDGSPVGKVTKKVAELLCSSAPLDPVFEIVSSEKEQILTLVDSAGSTIESRTASVMSVMTNLKSQGIITGWRDELYPLSTGFYNEPLLFVERAAAPFLGMLQYGVHINGLVKSNDGEKMWIARRSPTKSQYPGMTDQIVAGGQPAGLGLMENVLKGKHMDSIRVFISLEVRKTSLLPSSIINHAI